MENLRISSYIIPVKLEREEDKYMLIHGYTGAMDVVDKELKNYLISTMNIERSKFPYSDLVFDRLLKRGYLTIKSKSEEHDFVLKLANALHKRKLKKQFTLLVTYNCNFQCPYCFEKQIVQKSNETYSHVISEKLVDNAFEAINIIEPNEYLQSKKISLFGGEPLLKENKSIVEYILEKGKERGFNFSATSNGYDIDQYEKYLSKEYINGIQITIDGTKEIHNLRRIGPSPDGSFDKIIDNIELALSKGILIKARINVDDKNISSIKSLCSFFEQKGFFDYKNFSVYADFIAGDFNFNPDDYNIIKSISYKDFLNVISQDDLPIEYEQSLYWNIHNAIQEKRPLMLSSIHCNALGNSYIFDPFGYIYSCLDMVGKKERSIGTYKNNIIVWNEEKNIWDNRNVAHISPCNKCKYLFLCGGGCTAKILNAGKPINSSYCDHFPFKLNYIVNKICTSMGVNV